MGIALSAIGGAMLAPLGASVKVAKDFEHAINGVKAVVNSTEAEFDALKKKAQELGAATQFTAKEAAEGMRFLAMTGYNAGQVISAIEPMLNLAAAGNMELARTADIVSNIMQGFKIPAEAAAEATNTLAVIATSANTNIEQLGDAMKYAAPAAASLKQTMGQAAAAIGVMSDAGIQASMAGTALRRILLRLADPPDAARAALKKLGVEVAKTSDGNIDLAETFTRLRDAGMGAVEAQKLFGIYASSGGLAMAAQVEKMKDLESKTITETQALKKMVATMTTDLHSALIRVKSAFEALGQALGGPWLDSLREVADGFANAIRAIVGFLNAHPILAKAITGITAVMGGLILVLGAAALAVAGLSFAASQLGAGWRALVSIKQSGVRATLASITALKAETAAVQAQTRAITALNASKAGKGGRAASAVGRVASTAGILAGGELGGVLAIGGEILTLFAGIAAAALSIVAAVAAWGAAIYQVYKYHDELVYWAKDFLGLLDDVKLSEAEISKLNKEYNATTERINQLKAKGKDLTAAEAKELDNLNAKLGTLEEKYKKVDAGQIADRAIAYANDQIEAAKSFMAGYAQMLRDFGVETAEQFKRMFGVELPQSVAEALKNTVDPLSQFKKKIVDVSKEISAEIANLLKNIKEAVDAFTKKISADLEKADEAFSDFKRTTDSTLSDQKAAFDSYFGAIKKAVKETAEAFKAELGKMRDALSGSLGEAASSKDLEKFVSSLKSLKDASVNQLESLKSRTKSLLNDLKSEYARITKALGDLSKNSQKEMQNIEDLASQARRAVERRGLPDEKAREKESWAHLTSRMGEATELAGSDQVEDLERAREIYKEIIREAQNLKSAEVAMAAIRTAEQSALEVQKKLEESRRAELEKQKQAVQDQIDQVTKLRGEIEKMIFALSSAIKLQIDDAQAKAALAKLREEVAKEAKTKVGADTTAASEAMDRWRAEQEGKVVRQKIVVENGSAPEGFASGGKVGGRPGIDTNLIAATRDEWIINPTASRYYGDSVFAALNAMAIPAQNLKAALSGIGQRIQAQLGGVRFALGGKVGTDDLSRNIAEGLRAGLDAIADGITSSLSQKLNSIQVAGATAGGGSAGISPEMIQSLKEAAQRMERAATANEKQELLIKVSGGEASVSGTGKVRLY